EWNNSLKTKLSLLPKKLFRIRMSRNFGMKMLTMTNLSTECLIQLTKLGYDATPFNQILKQNAKREIDRKSGSAGMPRPISYAVFCLKKKNGAAGPLHRRVVGRVGGDVVRRQVEGAPRRSQVRPRRVGRVVD